MVQLPDGADTALAFGGPMATPALTTIGLTYAEPLSVMPTDELAVIVVMRVSLVSPADPCQPG
jgi:hypothetical protein